jgi:precorrin-3B synthase
LAFGAGDVAQWERVAELADQFGIGELRVSPERELLMPGVRESQSRELAAAVRGAGLIADDDAPLRRVTACAGAPRCGSARGETRELARRCAAQLQPLLAAGARLHVSGCEKSCAFDGPAEITLVPGAGGLKLGLGLGAAETAVTATRSQADVLNQLRWLARSPTRPATAMAAASGRATTGAVR